MIDRNAVLPAAWNALVNALCKEAPHLQNTLAPDVARFSRTKATPGGLSAFTTSLLGYNGSPLEFTVSSAKPQGSPARWILLPRYAQRRSAGAFVRHCEAITAAPLADPANSLEAVRRMQCASVQPLRFGAWLGRKYAPDAIKTKVYVETPRTWRPHPMVARAAHRRGPPRGGIDAADGGVLPGICRLSARILLPVAQCADHA